MGWHLTDRRRLAAAAALAAAVLLPRAAPAAPSILDDRVFAAAVGRGLQALYDFRFAEARREFAAASAAYPGHPVAPLLELLPEWWGTVLLNPYDTSADSGVAAGLDAVLARGARRLESDARDADGRFFRAAAFAFRGRLRSLRDEWIAAAWDGRRALALIRELAAEQPDNADLAFGLGLYDYFADVVPERYPIFRPLKPFFPAADRRRGIARLAEARARGRFAATEAGWALVFVYGEFEGDFARCLEQVRWLRRRHPGNPIFHLEEGRALADLESWEESRRVFTELLARRAAGAAGYGPYQELVARYYVGRAHAVAGRHLQAAAEFRRVEPVAAAAAPASVFRTRSWLRLGIALDAQGRRAEALSCYRRVLELRDTGDAHRRAREYLRRAPAASSALGALGLGVGGEVLAQRRPEVPVEPLEDLVVDVAHLRAAHRAVVDGDQ